MIIPFNGFHLIRCNCYCKAPVDEGYGSEERCHEHVAQPAGFKKEETNEAEDYAVDYAEPPVFDSAACGCSEESLDAPEYEYNGKEVGEYHFREYNAADEHKAYEHVDNTTGNPPAPAFGRMRTRGDTQLDYAGQNEKPAENLRCDCISGGGPEPICKSPDNEQNADKKDKPPQPCGAEVIDVKWVS